MATSFFGGSFFGGEFFNEGTENHPRPDDGGARGKGIFKPLGILHLPKKPAPQGRKSVDERADDSANVAAEIAAQVAREFGEETGRIPEYQAPPVVTMTMAQINAEIGMLLRKKMRTEDDEIMLLMLMAASAV